MTKVIHAVASIETPEITEACHWWELFHHVAHHVFHFAEHLLHAVAH